MFSYDIHRVLIYIIKLFLKKEKSLSLFSVVLISDKILKPGHLTIDIVLDEDASQLIIMEIQSQVRKKVGLSGHVLS